MTGREFLRERVVSAREVIFREKIYRIAFTTHDLIVRYQSTFETNLVRL